MRPACATRRLGMDEANGLVYDRASWKAFVRSGRVGGTRVNVRFMVTGGMVCNS